MEGYEVIEKMATQYVTFSKVLVSRNWIGKKVSAVRLDPNSKEKKED
ncbi:MAG: DUF2080 family transposase-associated protein [Nitrososphaerota archaeon]